MENQAEILIKVTENGDVVGRMAGDHAEGVKGLLGYLVAFVLANVDETVTEEAALHALHGGVDWAFNRQREVATFEVPK